MNEDLYLSDNFHLEEIADYQKGNTILPNGQMENTKQSNGISRKGEPIPVANQVLNTFTNSVDIKNLSDFTSFEKIVIDENEIDKSQKVNPFTLITHLEKERKIVAPQKERKADAEPKAERKPNPTYEAFTVFCQTFEQLSGAAYPTDQKGHYIMSPKDAGGMVYLLRWLEKVDRNNDINEALKVFLQAAWSLPDKWLKANFTPAILYGQAGKIYTAYQTSSPAAKKKAYDDEVDRLLAEAMKKYQTQ
jgi:hypothetical protein